MWARSADGWMVIEDPDLADLGSEHGWMETGDPDLAGVGFVTEATADHGSTQLPCMASSAQQLTTINFVSILVFSPVYIVI